MYEPFCLDCGSPLMIRLAVADGNRRGKATYKCGAIATIYGLMLPDHAKQGCANYLRNKYEGEGIVSCKK
jgi:hypothetical protein